ncbi:MAG: CBS domain-containing protein [Pseudomonadota bacterium]
MTQVKDLMESGMESISADATLQEAATKMKDVNCGFLPVGTADQPEGIITDRDIVIRAIAEGHNPSTERVRDYMTANICSVEDSETIEDAANKMHENHVSRLVVKDTDGKLCGVLTFGRILRQDRDQNETKNVVNLVTGKVA